MRNPLSDKITTIKPSGIRKFFDLVSEMKDAISLGVGEPDFDTPEYINEQEIDLRSNRIYLDEQMNLVGNFTLKFYGRGIPTKEIGEEDYFLTLKSIDGDTYIKMKESENRIHVYKEVKPKPYGSVVVSHYASPIIENYVPGESYLVIQINHVNRRIDVFAQVTEQVA